MRKVEPQKGKKRLSFENNDINYYIPIYSRILNISLLKIRSCRVTLYACICKMFLLVMLYVVYKN